MKCSNAIVELVQNMKYQIGYLKASPKQYYMLHEPNTPENRSL